MLFSIVAATSYTPTNSVWGFHILYTLFFSSTLLFVDFLMSFDRCEVITHCCFDYVSLIISHVFLVCLLGR